MATVLLIDDEIAVRTILKLFLASAGHEVREIGSAVEGLLDFRQSPSDIVVCDIFMPGMDGLEFLRELHRSHPAAKVILMSGGCDALAEDYGVAGLHLGAAATLYKPVDRQRLLKAIDDVLAK